MNDIEFKAMLELVMCCDPWPVEGNTENQAIIKKFVDEEATARLYSGWVEAYHDISPGGETVFELVMSKNRRQV